MKRDLIVAAVLAVVLTFWSVPRVSAEVPSEQEQLAYETSVEAYVYAYPLVLMEMTRRVYTNVEAPDSVVKPHAPMNSWGHVGKFPDASFKYVVKPNVDTLYSSLFADVSQEPIVVTVPDSKGRYYLLQMLDMWTDTFASVGSRTTGNVKGTFVVASRDWLGKLPDGMIAEVIRTPTPTFWIIGRAQTNGTKDYEAVQEFQKGLGAVPLSAYGKDYVAPTGEVDSSIDMKTPPPAQVASMDAKTYFKLFAELMRAYPPHGNDYPILHRMRRHLGLVAGKSLDFDSLGGEVMRGMEGAVKDGQKAIGARLKRLTMSPASWLSFYDCIGTYGTSYLSRALIAYIGLGANPPEDAFYPTAFKDADGKPLNGANDYVLRFDRDQLPPAKAFWSITMYGDDNYFVDNPLDRYALSDRDDLQYGEDGSLRLYIQKDSPGKDRESNWLPAPEGRFGLTARLYWPRPEALNGIWNMPAVERIER